MKSKLRKTIPAMTAACHSLPDESVCDVSHGDIQNYKRHLWKMQGIQQVPLEEHTARQDLYSQL